MTISELKVGTRVTGKTHTNIGHALFATLTGTVSKIGPGTDVFVDWDSGGGEQMDPSELSASKTAAPASMVPGASADSPKPGVGNYNNDTATVAAVQKRLAVAAEQVKQMLVISKSFGPQKASEVANAAKATAAMAKLDPKRTDGVYDDNTAAAVKVMQQQAGVPATGIIDDWLLAELQIPKPKSSGSFAAFMTKKYASVPVYGWAVIGTVVVISAGYFIKKGKR